MHRRCFARGVALAAALLMAPTCPAGAEAPPAASETQPRTPAPGEPARAMPTPGRVLTLTDAIALALQQQPTITSAQQSEVAAQARIGEAKSAYFPRFDWLGSVGSSNAFSSSQHTSTRSDSTSTFIQGSQLLYDFGKTASTVDQARAGAQAANAQLEQVRVTVVQNVRTHYFNVLAARRLTRVAEESLARSELNLKSAQGFFDVGTKPKSDVTKAEVDVANARVTLIRAQNLVKLAVVNLANALGLPETIPLQLEDILTYEPVVLDLDALRAEARANRPELKQVQAQVDAARAQFAGARAGFLPNLNLTGIYGTSSGDALIGVGGVAWPTFGETWSIALNLSWNLFQGFLSTNQVKETEALVRTARANYDAQELQVRLDVEQAYIGVTEASERIGATAKAVESAQENLRLAQGRYDAGVGTILDLSDARVSLTQAEADQVQALTDYRVGLANLDRAVGRR